jgi:hypothetical protein
MSKALTKNSALAEFRHAAGKDLFLQAENRQSLCDAAGGTAATPLARESACEDTD